MRMLQGRCRILLVFLLPEWITVSSSAFLRLHRPPSPPVVPHPPATSSGSLQYPRSLRDEETSSSFGAPANDCEADGSRRGFLSTVLTIAVGCPSTPGGIVLVPVACWAEDAVPEGAGAAASSVASDPLAPSSSAGPRRTARAPATASILALLPATRVRQWIGQAVAVASAVVQLDDDALNFNNASSHREDRRRRNRQDLVEALSAILLPRREFVRGESEALAARQYQSEPTLGAWDRARRREEKADPMWRQGGPSPRYPIARFDETFQQWGARRQFRRLQAEQRALERDDPVRAALNAYTNNLLYGPQYVLTAKPQERSRLIRHYNGLPDVTSVVRSDLDLRDLYRNQLLTALDDARAEWRYQLGRHEAEGDDGDSDARVTAADTLEFLLDAQAACDKWFALVDPQEAERARLIVESELDSSE